jgi:para-aminobenzoate synthetase/4-amino-4-deoxychorismate lyase
MATEPDPPETFVLLDDPLGRDGGCWLLQAPEHMVICWSAATVGESLERIAAAVNAGWHAAGFFAYELGYLLEPRLAPLLPAKLDIPLVWFGLFKTASRLSADEARHWLHARAGAGYAVRDGRLSMDRARYGDAFKAAQSLIGSGDVYQINLTLKYQFGFDGDPVRLFLGLRRQQRVGCGALIHSPDFHVLSLSPELFLRIADGQALVRPMKGTACRGASPEEDARLRAWLAADEKSRAENLMIVDLMRNDLGRLARTGSVRVTDLFTVETFRSLHQMTSGVMAELRDDIDLPMMLRALFPCGSVTGAPKIRAMEVIRELEGAPRGVYTGAIGLLTPGRRMFLNVAIRTLVLHADGRGEMGIGSGVVFDSVADVEFDECLLKAEFLTKPLPPVGLIETLRWERGSGYVLLDRHLSRLAASAESFAIEHDAGAARMALLRATRNLDGDRWRVRLMLDEDGEITVSVQPLRPLAEPLCYAVSDRPVSSGDRFLYHKTTRRGFYDEELARMRAATDCDEVLFVNERGELTEGSWTNLFVRRGRKLLTPPVACGLLDGTLRRELLETRPGEVEEAVLRRQDLARAEAVFLGNSVRGLLRAHPAAPSALAPGGGRRA